MRLLEEFLTKRKARLVALFLTRLAAMVMMVVVVVVVVRMGIGMETGMGTVKGEMVEPSERSMN